jgi:uncharacterized OsmC-like protein
MSNELPIEVESESENHTELDAEVRGHEPVVDEPEKLGGGDKGPNPLEYLFTGLAGCLNITIHRVARQKEAKVKNLNIDVSGNLDMEEFKEGGAGKRAGFEDINVEIEMETDSNSEVQKEILEESETRCPVSDNIQNSTNVHLTQK